MPSFTSFIEPDSTLSQLDRQLRELTREHGHVLRLDELRRHLDEHQQIPHGSVVDTARVEQRNEKSRH